MTNKIFFEKTLSVYKALLGIYGLALFIYYLPAFTQHGSYGFIFVPAYLPFIVLGVFGCSNLIGKPINIKAQIIFELLLLTYIIFCVIEFCRELLTGHDFLGTLQSNPFMTVYSFIVLPTLVMDVRMLMKALVTEQG